MLTRHVHLIICCVFVLSPATGANLGGTDVNKTAQQYIAEFRRWASVKPNDSVQSLVGNRGVDKASLSTLAKELSTGTPPVRENIVRLLELVGLKLDPANPAEFPTIRDHSVIRALAVEGFSRDDAAAILAESILRKRCRPSDLAAINDVYIKSLQRSNGEYLYLVAKAKTTQARDLVENLAQSPAWREHEGRVQLVRIAQAALGNTAVEDKFIEAVFEAERNAPPAPKNEFYDVSEARDGEEVAERLEFLGLIGTRRSLRVACSYLRSSLKAYVPNASEQSIRYAALHAIAYNFPEERILSHPVKVTEWAAAEQFCAENLGAVYEGPTPNFQPDRPYPTHIRPGRAQS
jgi:hypothetical protein